LVAVLSVPALAQESIFDSENPATPQQTPETETSGPESIFDPENPGGESIFDPRNTSTQQAPGATFSGSQGYFTRSWLRGQYSSRLFVDTGYENDTEDVFLFQNRLNLRARLDFSSEWTAIVEGRLEYRLWGEGNPADPDLIFNGEHYQGYFEPSLRDANLSARFDNLFLTIGNQSIVWGAGTFTQPADVINPLDYRGGVFDTPADQRIPIFAVESALVLGSVSLTAVFVPFFTPHRIDLFGTDFSFSAASESGVGPPILGRLENIIDPSIQPGLQEHLLATELPEALPENMSAGARITSTSGGIDLGLGYFFGWDRTPFIEIDADLAALLEIASGDAEFFENFDLTGLVGRHPEVLGLQTAIGDKAEAGETIFSSRYMRRHTIELDMVTYVGPIGVRLESAYTLERTIFLDGFESARFPVINNALAISWEESESLVIHVEGFYLHVFDLPDDSEVALTGQDYYGVLLLLNLGLDRFDAFDDTALEDISFRISGLAGLAAQDFLIYPSATWSISDTVDISGGAMIFEGPSPAERITLGGLYDNNDQAYIAVDLAF
jgi:hypothetical protein